MKEELAKHAEKIISLMNELKSLARYKKALLLKLKLLDNDYHDEKLSFKSYEKARRAILEGKTKEQWVEYYNSLSYSILKKIEDENSHIFYKAYKDTSYEELKIKKPILHSALPSEKVPIIEKSPDLKQQPISSKDNFLKEKPSKETAFEQGPLLDFSDQSVFNNRAKGSSKFPESESDDLKKLSKKSDEDVVFFNLSKDGAKKHGKITKQPKNEEKSKGLIDKRAKKDGEKEEKNFLKLKKQSEKDWEKIFGEEKHTKAEKITTKGKTVELSPFYKVFIKLGLVKSLRKKFKDYENITADKTNVGSSVLNYNLDDIKLHSKYDKISREQLEREAKRIHKKIVQEEKMKIYKPSLLGSISNFSMRGLSMSLVDSFPDFFKKLYHAIRLANIPLLSNTYINIMVMFTLISFFSVFVISSFILYFSGVTFSAMLFLKALVIGLFAGIITFFGAYMYPFSKLKQRRTNINTNLSFALDNMAAVSSSGVPPIVMFRLISKAKEYGEVSIEIEKVVDYVDVFGCDLLTAIRIVSETTPNSELKDVFEGFITTVEAGGNIDSYLKEKANEASNEYQMKRRKFVQVVSTYSDIYTGLMIAAPLFFVATITLISMMGGTIGGINANSLVVLGTYLVIPLLNVLFLIFLEVTQPEI